MKNNYKYEWNAETGTTTCSIISPLTKNLIIATAQCHSDDFDMSNKLTGEDIAIRRLDIKILQDYVKNWLKPGLAALKQLYYTMKHSSKYSPRGYEAKRLYRQIKIYEEEIEVCQEEIAFQKADLHQLILKKDAFYKSIRNKRKAIKPNV